MPEIRERDPNDFIKSKGKGKHRGKKGSIAPRIDNAVRGKVREHQSKKEEANEYAYKHNLIPFSVSSPNYGLAHQMQDPWGGGCVTISGKENDNACEWYKKNGMAVVAYSSLGRGFFSGRLKSSEPNQAKEILDAVALKAYDCEENYERLRRCELLAEKKHCTVALLALRWIFARGMDTYAVVSTQTEDRIKQNLAALNIELTEAEGQFLNLEMR